MRGRIAGRPAARKQRVRRRGVSALLRLEKRLGAPPNSGSSFAPEEGVAPYHGTGVRRKRAPTEEPREKRRLRSG